MIFLYSKWMALPISTRMAIAKQFGIAKTGSTHVSNNEIISDGYKIKDIENAVTDDAIKAYLGVESADPWNDLLAKVEGRVVAAPVEEPVMTIDAATIEELPEEPIEKPKRKRVTKKK